MISPYQPEVVGVKATAAGILALLAVCWSVAWLADQLPSGLAEILGSVVIGIPLSVLTTVGLFVIYLAHTEASSGDDPTPPSYQDSDAPV